jgi:hypothetical protein
MVDVGGLYDLSMIRVRDLKLAGSSKMIVMLEYKTLGKWPS